MTLSKGARQTWIAVAAVLALVVLVGGLALSAQSGAPTSVDGVRAEAMALVDDIGRTLPESAVVSSADTSSIVDCPDGSEGRMASIERRIALDPAFDRTAWPAELRIAFPAQDGWDVRTRPLGNVRDDVRVTIVGTSLLIVDVRSVAGDGEPHVTIGTTSRCSAE